MGPQHRAYGGKNPTLLTDLCNITTGEQVIEEDNQEEYQKGVYTGIEVTGKCSSHLYEEKGWGTAYVYRLPIAEYYYCKELLSLTPNY